MKRKYLLLFNLGLIMAAQLSFGQAGIGIGTTSPDPSAMLHIYSPSQNKGLLLPSFAISKIPTISTTAASNGVLFYDPGIGKICYYYNNTWHVLNPFDQAISSGPPPSVTSTASLSGNLSVTGNVASNSISTNSITVPGFPTNALVPYGVIVMWHGSIATIPSGWALCDGGNGTPDLRDRFIVGAGNGYGVTANGGEALHTLTEAEMPSHSHDVYDPGHAHPYDRISLEDLHNGSGSGNPDGPSRPATTGSSTTGISIYPKGGGAAFENRPPFYALAYIMKL